MVEADVYEAEGLGSKIKVEGGSFSVKIRPFEDKKCYLGSFELVSLDKQDDLDHIVIRGRESLAINEVMQKPSFEVMTTENQNPGGDWVWKGSFFQTGRRSRI